MAILDLAMPGMDGLILAQLIKTDPATANTRLLMISSIGGRADAGARAVFIESWLSKPVRQSQLYDSLAALMTAEIATAAAAVKPSQKKKPVGESLESSDPLFAMRQRIRILVAEDNLINQSVAKHQLHKIGYLFDIVENGSEALEA